MVIRCIVVSLRFRDMDKVPPKKTAHRRTAGASWLVDCTRSCVRMGFATEYFHTSEITVVGDTTNDTCE